MPLNDEEFDELLHKRLAAADEDVAGDCEALTEEEAADLATMREALGSYKAETLAWAEKRSAAMPSPQHSAAAALWDRLSNGAPRWALAGVAAAVCAATVVSFTHIAAPAPVSVAAPNAQVLAADNHLLSSVDDALAGSSSIPSEQQLGLSSADLPTRAQDSQKQGRTRNSIN